MNLAEQTQVRCRSCIHWVANGAEAMAVRAEIGECRAGPPVANYSWPRTRADQHCGQHKPRKGPITAKREGSKRIEAGDGSLLSNNETSS